MYFSVQNYIYKSIPPNLKVFFYKNFSIAKSLLFNALKISYFSNSTMPQKNYTHTVFYVIEAGELARGERLQISFA